MAARIPVVSGLLGAGTTKFGPIAVPVGVTGLTAEIDRTQLLSTTLRADWSIELSVDGGATWTPWGGAGTAGGLLTDVFNTPITVSYFHVGLLVVTGVRNGQPYMATAVEAAGPDETIVPGFEPTNAQRMLRGQITLNEAATSALTVVTSP